MAFPPNLKMPLLQPPLPYYPIVRQLVRVAGVASPSPLVYSAFVQQFDGVSALRDRETCYVFEPNAMSLSGTTRARLVGNYAGLPLYAASRACCVPSSSSSSAVPSPSSLVSSSSVAPLAQLCAFYTDVIVPSSSSVSGSSSTVPLPPIDTPCCVNTVSAQLLFTPTSGPGCYSPLPTCVLTYQDVVDALGGVPGWVGTPFYIDNPVTPTFARFVWYCQTFNNQWALSIIDGADTMVLQNWIPRDIDCGPPFYADGIDGSSDVSPNTLTGCQGTDFTVAGM